MVASVDEVTSSLVREYLSRKGLKGTIACMDEELPRTHNSINNRSELREILHMESLYKKNKVQQNPLKTLLEIIIKHHIEGHNTVFNEDPLRAAQNNPNANLTAVAGTSAVMNDNRTEDNSRPQHGSKDDISRSFPEEAYPYQSTTSLSESDRHTGHDRTDFWSGTSDIQRDQPLVARLKENESSIKREREQRAGISESHNCITENAQKNRTHTRIRRGMMAGPVASSSQESSKKRQSRRASVPHPLLGNEEDTNISTRGGPSMTGSHERSPKSGLTRLHTSRSTKESQPSRSPPEKGWSEEPFEKDKLRKKKSLSNQNMNDQHLSEMILDDIDDDEELRELSTLSLHSARPIPQCSYDSYPMDLHTAIALKEIFLGSSSSCFSTEWRNQGFTFSETPDLTYGIVQKKGGPCGVLASIQACVLKKMLFEGANGSNTGLQGLRPSCSTRRKCLMLAAAEVLWRAGEQKQAIVAITSGRNNFIPPVHFKSEGVFEKIMCITVDNLKDLQLLLEQHIQLFENGALGCILLTISAVLSRSIEKVRDDMDVPTTTLIGAYGYCTQELVNLLLCGSAVSNVFDNDMELDSGNGNLTLLKGIKGHCDIGLLSLFEHYNICEVGARLQTPRFPIWVVFSESHFSVLFGLQRELLTKRDEAQDFDLYYYDGLANQQEEIRLTVSVGIPALASQDVDPDLIPPLEHCIRTKWKDAVVNWNSTEPIL